MEAEAGPNTLVIAKKGWEKTFLDVKAEVYEDSGEWKVNFLS